MLGYQRRLEASDTLGESAEVIGVERIGRAEREPDAVEAQRIALAEALQPCERRAAIGEEILGMDLEECERRAALEKLGIVRRPQADAGAARGDGRGQVTCPCRRCPG